MSDSGQRTGKGPSEGEILIPLHPNPLESDPACVGHETSPPIAQSLEETEGIELLGACELGELFDEIAGLTEEPKQRTGSDRLRLERGRWKSQGHVVITRMT
jgi:hypothetical protein